MRICQYIKADCANGPGVRLTIFVSGCTNHCKGCFQPETWDFNYGIPFTDEMEAKLLEEASKPWYKGITVLGGEPMEPCNQAGLLPFLTKFKARNPEKSIWIFTGFTFDSDLRPGGKRYLGTITDGLLGLADVIVDGRFHEEKKDLHLNFRGSRNQRIIDVKPSLETGTVVLDPLNN